MSAKTQGKTSLDSVKNKSIDEVDWTKVDLQRGVTPEDITEKCLKLCKDYLSGDWEQQTIDTIQVKRVSGGLTNQLYHCAITNTNPSSTTPQEVVIRLYGSKYWVPTGDNENERFPDTIVAGMVSQNKIGPHVYGLFEGGQILKYYKHRHLSKDDQGNDKIVRQVFSSLARIHALDVPIKKNFTMFEKIDEWYEKVSNDPGFRQELQEFNCKTLLEKNIREEIEWCRELVATSDSPVVFTHNDYRSLNLMITEPDDELVVCDFEYACYGFRGQDFVGLFHEWGRELFDFKGIGTLIPDEELFKPLIEIYVEESERIFGKEWSQNPINSVQHIYNEIRLHMMPLGIFGVLFFSANNPDEEKSSPIPRKVCLELAERTFKQHFLMKQKLIDDNVMKNEF